MPALMVFFGALILLVNVSLPWYWWVGGGLIALGLALVD